MAQQVDGKHQKPSTTQFCYLQQPVWRYRENFSSYEFFSALKEELTCADNTNNATCVESNEKGPWHNSCHNY